MTTSTITGVGRRTGKPTVLEIGGFRGRLIARCIGTADVVAAVRFARDHNLEIAVRGGAGVAGLTLGY